MTFKADWLVGAIEPLPAYAYSVSGTAYGIATANYYLYDATGTRSMLQQLEDDIEAKHPGQNASVFLTEAGHVRITCDVSFSITWTDSAFRDLLGFTANITNQTAVTATNKSPLFWSPSYPGTPAKSPTGVVGTKIYDTVITSSPSGDTMQATGHHTKKLQAWTWQLVPVARVWTTDEDGLPGEFRRLYDDVLRNGYRYKHYVKVDEGTGTTDITGSLPTPLGPYKIPRTNDDWWNRSIQNADTHSRISFEAQKTTEFS